jgi:hypothetical protein
MDKYFEDIGVWDRSSSDEKDEEGEGEGNEEIDKEEGEEIVPEFGKTSNGGLFHNFSAI